MNTNSPKRIRAFLLAAGLGTRLRPITDIIPKCLVPIGNKPLLSYWMESLIQAGVGEALINTHWLAEQVDEFANNWGDSRLMLKTFYEPKLLGSAGTIAANADWAANADALLVIYADNFCRIDLRPILHQHFVSQAELTLGVFTATNPRRCGVVEIDAAGRGLSFEEKPSRPKSNLAAAGLYVLSPNIVHEIKTMWKIRNGVFDLGCDVFPQMIRRAMVFSIIQPLTDIGTIKAYEDVCRSHQISDSAKK